MSDFKNKYGLWAYIAGASEGIGESFSHQIAAQGVNLVMVARRQEPLERTAEVIRSTYGVEVRTHSLDLAASDLLVRVKQLT